MPQGTPDRRVFQLNWEKLWRALTHPKFLSVQGSISIKLVANSPVKTEYTAGNETVILVDAASGPVTINLLEADTVVGRLYKIKKIDTSDNRVVIDPFSNETVDGETTLELGLQYRSIEIFSDGTEWWILGEGGMSLQLEVLKDKLAEQNELLYKILMEGRQSKLHLASISGENINERDVED